jgi:DNA-binding IclR family transcriptional regulator
MASTRKRTTAGNAIMARRPAGEESTSSGTVARVALMLRALAEAGGDASLSDIAARMKLPPSTTHRLLNLLQEQGFVERGQDSRSYRAGLELLRVAGLITSRAQLTDVAQDFMRAVVDACDETCMLSVYLRGKRSTMIAKVIYGSHPLRYEATLYQPTSLVWGATGLGILAFLPQDVIDDVIAHEGPSPASGDAITAVQLRRELARIRERGYAHTRGQKIPGAVGISAPVCNGTGVVAALCITLPDSRFQKGMEARLAGILKDQAASFSAALGWRDAAAAA